MMVIDIINGKYDVDVNPLTISPELTQAGIYGKRVL